MQAAQSSRRRFLAAASSLALPASARPAPAAPPNVLYIMTDQQHAGMMSCTGNRWLKTPAMDTIASSGMRFELAYSANPVCVPARTSMMTGRYPSHFGIRGNQNRPLPPETPARALGNLFRAGGYRTVFGGKTHWPRPMTPESVGFEYLTSDERDDLADKCSEFLRRPQDRPFLLVASFEEHAQNGLAPALRNSRVSGYLGPRRSGLCAFINPHDICYMAIDAFTKAENRPAMYPKSTVERQRVAEASALPPGVSQREFFQRHCPPLPSNHGATSEEPAGFGGFGGFRAWARKNWSAEDWRLHRWTYCRLTERVDTEIGRVLSALRGAGLERDTLVVFSSDHGDMDSAHGFEHKSLPYEESARIPFLVSWPGHIPAGRVDRRHLLSASVDLLPTLCDYAGIQPPAGLPGRSVRPIASGGSPAEWRRDVVIECSGGRSVRTRRYKYTLWEGTSPREMLIDMEKDPGEMTNLAGRPALAGVMAEHRRLLGRHAEERNDEFGRSLLASAQRTRGDGAVAV